MSSIGHPIPKQSASERYATEAASVYLKTLGLKHEPKTNLSTLITGKRDRSGR